MNELWTTARDGWTRIHVRSWSIGLRQGILFGVQGGIGIGGCLVGLAWYFFG